MKNPILLVPLSPCPLVSLSPTPLASSPPLTLRPLVALNKNLAVGRHPRFGETEAGFQLQLDSDDLFHALVAEVGVFRREGGFGVDARDVGFEGLVGDGIEVDARRLSHFDFAYLTYRDEATQIDLGQIQHSDDWGSGRHHFPRLGGSRRDRAVERRGDDQVPAVLLGLAELGASLFGARSGGGYLSLLLRHRLAHGLGRGPANQWVDQIRFGRFQRAACRLVSTLRGGHRRRLLRGL